MKKRLVAPCLSLTLERSDSVVSEDFLSAGLSPDEDFDINIDELETPSDNESFTFPESMHELEWEDELPRRERSQEGSEAALRERERSEESQPTDEEDSQGRKWRLFRMGEQEYRVNMSVLEPYLRVLLRKNLKAFLVVHPSWYMKALTTIVRPFISAKFSRKLRFLKSLRELSELISMEHVHLPECITQSTSLRWCSRTQTTPPTAQETVTSDCLVYRPINRKEDASSRVREERVVKALSERIRRCFAGFVSPAHKPRQASRLARRRSGELIVPSESQLSSTSLGAIPGTPDPTFPDLRPGTTFSGLPMRWKFFQRLKQEIRRGQCFHQGIQIRR
ncbi:UNVERIFIED_CONTAM: hypothetical protein FKN15_024802 [Acipenser sinensis]